MAASRAALQSSSFEICFFCGKIFSSRIGTWTQKLLINYNTGPLSASSTSEISNSCIFWRLLETLEQEVGGSVERAGQSTESMGETAVSTCVT